MSRFTLIAGAWVLAAGVLIVLFLRDWVRPIAPSREECVALWNAPRNAPHMEEVGKRGYPSAEINGAFSEDRYQGCFATFSGDVGEPWALYSAARIPGTNRQLRWKPGVHVEKWGTGFPTGRAEPRPNAIVQPDGSLSLA